VQAVQARIARTAEQEKRHKPARRVVSEAQAAAMPPENDRLSRAQANQVEVMDQQEPARPDPNDFLTLLRDAIRAIAPSNMEETEKFKKEGKASQLKDTLTAKVNAQKAAAQGDIQSATEASPDPNSVPPKPVVECPKAPPVGPRPRVDATQATPKPRPEEDVSLQASKQEVEQKQREANITDEQLRKANDPRFSKVLQAKQKVKEHADTAPQAYREQEAATRAETAAALQADEETLMSDMHSAHRRAQNAVTRQQDEAQSKEEQERQRVADEIQGMFEQSKAKVEEILAGLDEEVNGLFDRGEATARQKFEDYVDRRMSDYKWDRYISRLGGSLLWAKDKLFGMPDEVNRFYEEGRDRYIADMDKVLVVIADTVESRLQQAKDEIAAGRQRIAEYVESLPKNLRKAGRRAQNAVSERFDALSEDVENKKQELADSVAQRYQEAQQALEERIEEMKAANRGLVDEFIGALMEVIEFLNNFRKRLMSILSEAGNAIELILADPIGFLGNLLSAVKLGFNNFVANIWDHLKAGLMTWLFGSLARAGITMPSDFSLKSIFGLVMQVLGLTRERIMAKVRRVIGPRGAAILDKVIDYFSTLLSEGPAGLWEQMKQDLSDLKDTILNAIKEWVVTRIIKSAVTKLVSMFNPAGAIIQAAITIYNAVMFFVENIDKILDLVQTIVRSVLNIAKGKISQAAAWIEKTLARTIPVIIAFLARLLGLGGIADRIKGIIKRIQKKVSKALDKVIRKVVGKLKRLFGRGGRPAATSPGATGHDRKLQAGLQALDQLTARYQKKGVTKEKLQSSVRAIKRKHPVFKALRVKEKGNRFIYEYAASPSSILPGPKKGTGDGMYKVGIHVVSPPEGAQDGNSHHVPAKVLQGWIGEIYEIAGKETGDAALKDRGKRYKKEAKKGTGLSAIWLTAEDHRKAHEKTAMKPADFRKAKQEVLIATRAGTLSPKPLRSTITRSVHEQALAGGSARTARGRRKEIYNRYAGNLKSLFKRVFDGMLRTGMAWVSRAKLSDGKWKAQLKGLARRTWSKIIDPKAND